MHINTRLQFLVLLKALLCYDFDLAIDNVRMLEKLQFHSEVLRALLKFISCLQSQGSHSLVKEACMFQVVQFFRNCFVLDCNAFCFMI